MPTLTLQEQTEYLEWSVISDAASIVDRNGLLWLLCELRNHVKNNPEEYNLDLCIETLRNSW